MQSNEDLKEIYRLLSAPFPEEAIERTKGDVTRKGYDTTGLKVQYILNRLNEVLGVGGFKIERTFAIRERQARSGQPMYEATCDLTMQLGRWEGGRFIAFAEAAGTGGHTATSEADARKGAASNAIKKTAATFGVGWQAYAGALDDDNVPATMSQRRDRGEQERGSRRHERSSEGNGRITTMQLARLRWTGRRRGW